MRVSFFGKCAKFNVDEENGVKKSRKKVLILR